jgi:hypothetical protein
MTLIVELTLTEQECVVVTARLSDKVFDRANFYTV